MVAARCAALAATIAALLPVSDGHGLLVFPPLRGGTGGSNSNQWCPHCGNGAGICGDGGQWGSSDFLGSPEAPKATFQAGQVVEFEIRITAHHRGHFQFSICDQQLTHGTQDAQGCLNRHRLRRASSPSDCVPNDSRGDCQPLHEKYPERWYLPPGAGTYKMKYVIPEGLQCAACTLQWQWFTANSCVPAPDYGCYFNEMRAKGWDADSWCGSMCGTCTSSLLQANASGGASRGCGEEFRNCADIAVVGSAGPMPSPAPIPAPMPSTSTSTTTLTTSAPTTVSPTTSTQSATVCVPLFDCGMHSWCDQQGFEAYCMSMSSGGCVSNMCKSAMPEPEPEGEPEPEPEPTAAPSSCHPTLSPYSLYCEDQFAQGNCPAPYCELKPIAAVQSKATRAQMRKHSFLGLLQTGGALVHGTERVLEEEL